MSCLYDELPVVALDFGSLLVCVGFASRHLLVPPLQRVMRIWVRCNGGALRLLGILLLSRQLCPEFDTGVYATYLLLNIVSVVALNGPLYPAD